MSGVGVKKVLGRVCAFLTVPPSQPPEKMKGSVETLTQWQARNAEKFKNQPGKSHTQRPRFVATASPRPDSGVVFRAALRGLTALECLSG